MASKLRIQKLREAESRLRRLHDDLKNGNREGNQMSESLRAHKSLASTRGVSWSDTNGPESSDIPTRVANARPNLTIPSRLTSDTSSGFADVEDSEEQDSLPTTTDSEVTRSRAKIKLNEIITRKQQIKEAALPNSKILNKMPYGRTLQNQRSRPLTNYKLNPLNAAKARKQFPDKTSSKGPQTQLSEESSALIKSQQATDVWYIQNELLPQTATSSREPDLEEQSMEVNIDKQSSSKTVKSPKSTGSITYALGKTSLMGVILPPSSYRGPNVWTTYNAKPSVASAFVEGEDDTSERLTPDLAMSILKRKRLPYNKSGTPGYPTLRERGLIGVEISNFEPQCAFFYRDTEGNYNPHLGHSKNIQDSIKAMR